MAKALSDPAFKKSVLRVPPGAFVLDDRALDALLSGKGYALFFHQTPIRRVLNSPADMAALLAASDIRPGQSTLLVGARGGYWEAVVAGLAEDKMNITVIEEHDGARRVSRKNLDEAFPGHRVAFEPIRNVLRGPFPKGPWDRIVITAAVEALPRGLIKVLARGGLMTGAIRNGEAEQLFRYSRRTGKLERLRPIILQRLRREEEAPWRLALHFKAPTRQSRGWLDASMESDLPRSYEFKRHKFQKSASDGWRADIKKAKQYPSQRLSKKEDRMLLTYKQFFPVGKSLANLLPRDLAMKLQELAAPILTLRQGLETQRTAPKRPLLIKTNAHDIPWELALLPERSGIINPFSQRPHFLWEEFVCGRLPEVCGALGASRPAADQPARALIAYTPGRGYGASSEARTVAGTLRRAGVECVLVKTAEELRRTLGEQDEPFDIFHFAGHAEAHEDPARSYLWLDEKVQAGGLFRGGRHLGSQLIFLNGCDAACPTQVDGEFGSLLGSLLNWTGLAVGPLWEVSPAGAQTVARLFYENLVRGEYSGQALRDAKGKTALGPYDSAASWAAYVLYGDPLSELFPR